ncbi:MAG TPA: tetraacyldisaccharide 4'-kinase [Sutterella sp.]|nr:tetraacyldisaccharide 4'-kinase [Sutterella sp.]
MLDPSFCDILACPICKGPVKFDSEASRVICPRCAMAFPVTKDGVPMMTEKDCVEIETETAQNFKKKPDI